MGLFVTPVFVGRSKELRQLDNILATVHRDAGRCVLVSGEAGIGKSRLIAEIRERADEKGFTALVGRCFEQDRSFPYAPLIDFAAFAKNLERREYLGALEHYITERSAAQFSHGMCPECAAEHYPEFYKV